MGNRGAKIVPVGKDCGEHRVDAPFSSMEAAIARVRHPTFSNTWNSVTNKSTLIENIQILEFLIERVKVHIKRIHEASESDNRRKEGTDDEMMSKETRRPRMKERAAVRALSAIGEEFEDAPDFAKSVLQHLDNELGFSLAKALFKRGEKMPTPKDADKLLESLPHLTAVFDGNFKYLVTSKPSGETALVAGSSADIDAWQQRSGFTETDIDPAPQSLHCFTCMIDSLRQLQAMHYPPLWWVRLLLNENAWEGTIYGLLEPIRHMADGLENGAEPHSAWLGKMLHGLEKVPIYLACESPAESSMEPWSKLCSCLPFFTGPDSYKDSDIISHIYRVYPTFPKWIEVVALKKLPQFQFLLKRMQAAMLGQLELATAMQQKILALSASVGIAAFSMLGRIAGSQLLDDQDL